MSNNAAMIFAALCAKAADVAVADKITEVSSPFAALPVIPSGTLAAVCARSRDFHIADEASQSKSCGNDKSTTSTNSDYHPRAAVDSNHQYNDYSRHSRRSMARSSNDIDSYDYDAARERTTLRRHLSEADAYTYEQPVSSSRHNRIAVLQCFEDPTLGQGHYLTDSCRMSRKSLIDDDIHSVDEESVQMDVHDFLEMAKQMVIAPSGGADQTLDLPVTTITRQKSTSSCDMSTTSSISDPDSRRDSVEDLVSNLDSENLIEALCKKAQTDSALARKLSVAAKQLTSRSRNEACEDDAVDDVIARLFSRLAAVDPGMIDTGSRGSRKSAQNKGLNGMREKSPRPAPTGGRRRKPRKGGKSQRQSSGDTDNFADDLSPKTATLPVLDRPSLISALAPHEVPSDEALHQIGWFKAVDATTGRYYFYTEDRSNVSWENPLTSSLPATTSTVPLNDPDDDPFAADPFAFDEEDETDDCFQVVFNRNESGRNVLAR